MTNFYAKAVAAATLIVTLGATSCQNPTTTMTVSGLDPAAFVGEYEGEPLALYTIKNANGMEVCLTNFGGHIVSVMVPDRTGEFKDVVLGFSSVQDYIDTDINFGATIGRYANRIAGGKFTLDGQEYTLFQNNGANCLHGGQIGFDRHAFKVSEVQPNSVKMTYISPDGQECFPGTLTLNVTFSVGEDNSLSIKYEAETDKPTLFNPTNHTYFNLNADGSREVLNNVLSICADSVTPTDEAQIPTGEYAPVEGTPFDFRVAKPLSEGIYDDDTQLKIGQGWDHNWVLNTGCDIAKCAAVLSSPETGIVMKTYTTEPGLQIYSGNFINGQVGKGGVQYVRRGAVCLETDHFPDSPNHPEFPTTVVRPGEHFCSQTIYAFSVDK